MALIERAHTDAMEAERLWKEWDDLLRAVEGLCMEHDLAHQEHKFLPHNSIWDWADLKRVFIRNF